jgi:hypothetical protein
MSKDVKTIKLSVFKYPKADWLNGWLIQTISLTDIRLCVR